MWFVCILSLPPTQQQQQRHSPPEDQSKEDVSKNRCKRFLGSCVKVLTCASCTALSAQCCNKQKTVDEGEKVGCCQSLKNKFSKHPRWVFQKLLASIYAFWFKTETRWELTSKMRMESRNVGFGRCSTVVKRTKWATRRAVFRWEKVGLRSAIKRTLYNLKKKKGNILFLQSF